MKFLIIVLMAFATHIARAESSDGQSLNANNLTVQGDMRLRMENLGNTDFVSNRAATLLRVRPMLTWKPNEQTTVVIQAEAAKAMGQAVYTPSSTTANTAQETSGASANGDVPMYFHQAYGAYKPVDWLSVSGGRQVLSYGNELVIGQADWNNISRSFDALKGRITHSWGWTDVFAAELVQTSVTAGGPGQKTLYGIYNGFNLGAYAEQFDLYALNLHDGTVSPASDVDALGARAQSKIGGADYRVEYTSEWHTKSGYQVDGEAGWTFDLGEYKPRISAEYFRASANYNQLFPTAHKWLGYADVLGRRNITGYALHLSSDVLSWMSAQADYHVFQRLEDGAPAYKLNGTTGLGTVAGSTSKDVGSEVDLTIKMKASGHVNFAVGGALFFSGTYLKDQFGSINPNFYYAQVETSF